jgi:hypothetical protein
MVRVDGAEEQGRFASAWRDGIWARLGDGQRQSTVAAIRCPIGMNGGGPSRGAMGSATATG